MSEVLSEEVIRGIVREEIKKIQEEKEEGRSKKTKRKKIQEDKEKEKRDLIEEFIDTGRDLARDLLEKTLDFVDEGTPIRLTGKHLSGTLFSPRTKKKR